LYITSSLGFVFSFKNILEKKFSDGQMQINDNTKECITHFELEKYEGKKVMFLVTYDGVVSVYSQEHEVINYYLSIMINLITSFIFFSRQNGNWFIQSQ